MMTCQFCEKRNDADFDCPMSCPFSTPYAERDEKGEILFFTYELNEKGDYVKQYCTIFELVERLCQKAKEQLSNVSTKKP